MDYHAGVIIIISLIIIQGLKNWRPLDENGGLCAIFDTKFKK